MSKRNFDSERTVSFNVGGQIFVLAQSTLDAFPSTMLARSASKEWRGDDADKPIFISSDSGRFRYCLDYMRVGKVWLPPTESKDALLSDLTYFGFENIDPTAIVATSNAAEVARYLHICHENLNKENSAIKILSDEVTEKRNRLKHANTLFQKFLTTGQTVFEFSSKPGRKSQHEPCEYFTRWNFDMNHFNECLAMFNLRVVTLRTTSHYYPRSVDITIEFNGSRCWESSSDQMPLLKKHNIR